MNTITIFIGGHGYEPDTHPERPETRSSDEPNRYPSGFKVNLLSFAGYAHVKTEAGIVPTIENLEEIIKKINRLELDKSRLFTIETVRQLEGLGTDQVTLSYLVPRIFNDKEIITSPLDSMVVMEYMKNEMLALGILAGLNYSPESPPVLIPNPHFKKMWWFDNNPGDDRRRLDIQEHTGPARAAGDRKYNPILSTNGLFILHTTNEEHQPFSISNIEEMHEFTEEGGLRLIAPDAIKRRNLLRKINYTSYWKKWIEAYDFSGVPDADVIEIGSITEALFIVTQIYYAFLHGTDNPADLDSDDELDEKEYVEDGEDVEGPVAKGPLPPPPLEQVIKDMLKAIIQPQTGEASELYESIKHANDAVQNQRDTFLKNANAADALEKMIEEINQRQMVTRRTSQSVDEMKQQLSAADENLHGQRLELANEKDTVATLESELDQLRDKIVADVTDFIRKLILLPDLHLGVKAAIKNIIMRNKLKNILKFGIFHKRLSLSQIILFFRSLGYNINIVDPTCFVLKAPRSFQTDLDTQEIDDSQQGLVKHKRPPPTHWTEEARKLVRILHVVEPPSVKRHCAVAGTPGCKGGGTKRKKSYSRKRRTRRKRRVTRRRRRMRK